MTADTRVKVVEAMLFYAAGITSDMASEINANRDILQIHTKLKIIGKLTDLASELKLAKYLDQSA